MSAAAGTARAAVATATWIVAPPNPSSGTMRVVVSAPDGEWRLDHGDTIRRCGALAGIVDQHHQFGCKAEAAKPAAEIAAFSDRAHAPGREAWPIS